jgi:hypothetical protein
VLNSRWWRWRHFFLRLTKDALFNRNNELLHLNSQDFATVHNFTSDVTSSVIFEKLTWRWCEASQRRFAFRIPTGADVFVLMHINLQLLFDFSGIIKIAKIIFCELYIFECNKLIINYVWLISGFCCECSHMYFTLSDPWEILSLYLSAKQSNCQS